MINATIESYSVSCRFRLYGNDTIKIRQVNILGLKFCLSGLQMALKCADIGHLAAAPELHKKWAKRLEEELFLQGDMERERGMPISPLMDRTSPKGGVTRSQVCSKTSLVCGCAEVIWDDTAYLCSTIYPADVVGIVFSGCK